MSYELGPHALIEMTQTKGAAMRTIAAFILALAAFAQSAVAQEPPARAGRLAYIEGSVSVYQDADHGWEEATVNAPITSQNSLWTEARSRAEMRVSGMALRLDATTQLDVATLDDNALAAFIPAG